MYIVIVTVTCQGDANFGEVFDAGRGSLMLVRGAGKGSLLVVFLSVGKRTITELGRRLVLLLLIWPKLSQRLRNQRPAP